MAVYSLTYDLRGQRDYGTLYAELESFSAVRVLESTWCFKRVNTSAKGLRDYFKKFVDSDDGLMVSEVADWSSLNALGTPNNLP